MIARGSLVRCSVFIATSLDGYIARTDGSIDWLEEAKDQVSPEEDFGFQAFFKTVDVLVMGRGTFETVLEFPEWYYGDKPVVVLSDQLQSLPAKTPATVQLLRGEPNHVLQQLETTGVEHLYIDGGKTIQRFLTADLIDEMTITTIPILLGSGIPLFGENRQELRWELTGSNSYACGYVQSRYRRSRDKANLTES